MSTLTPHTYPVDLNVAALVSDCSCCVRSRPLEQEQPYRRTSFCAGKQGVDGFICEMVAGGCLRALEALQGNRAVEVGVRSNEHFRRTFVTPTCCVHLSHYTSPSCAAAPGLHPVKHRSVQVIYEMTCLDFV